MSLIAARGARLALVVALLAPASCQMFAHSGPTAVAQGRYFSTGNPEYDSFFVELHRLQVELKDAPDRVAEPRQALAKTLDTGVDADAIKEALGKRVSELGGKQVKLNVQRSASPDKAPSLKVSGSPVGDDAEFVKTLTQTLTQLAELKTTIDGWKKSLEPLPEQEISLEGGVDAAFVGSPVGTRADIKHNLSDGQKMIGLLVNRANDAEHANSELFDAVVGALGETRAPSDEKTSEPSPAANSPTPANEKKAHRAPPPAPEPKPAKVAKPAPPPAPKPAAKAPAAKPKPAAKSPAPEPKPAAKPAAAERSELPPAPKPTQGTAKPDFEP